MPKILLLALTICLFANPAHASPQDRVTTKARVEADISKDLALA